MYKALNYWVFGGFDGQRTPEEFIDWAAEQGLDGVELTVGDCLPVELSEARCRAIAAYARGNGIDLVLQLPSRLSAGTGVVYSKPEMDITVEIMKLLGIEEPAEEDDEDASSVDESAKAKAENPAPQAEKTVTAAPAAEKGE